MSGPQKSGLSNIRTESELNAARVRVELQQLAGEVTDARNPQHREEIHRLVDKWLDQGLENQGRHKPSCRCDQCLNAHPLMRRHPLGECIDRRDLASTDEWGKAG